MSLTTLATRLSRSSTRIYFGEDYVSVKSFEAKGLNACFPKLAKEFKLDTAPIYKQMEVASKVLPLIKSRAEKSTTDETKGTIEKFLANNIIFEDYTKAMDFYVYNINSRKVTKFDAQIILRRMPREERFKVENNVKIATLQYDVYDPVPSKTIEMNDIYIQRLNKYQPPRWRKEFPEAKPEWLEEPPELFKQFLDFLVPVGTDREEVISWICWALIERHHSYLVLRGARGNGKTIFMKVIMGVIGDGYISLDGVTSGFNADMKHKRVIGIDDDPEIGSKKGHKKRKKFINSRVTYNEKHKQTTESEQQYASYIICSNPSDKFHQEYDERRVVQVGLTEHKLNETFSDKERNFLDGLGNDEEDLNTKQVEFLAHLGYWLIEKAKSNKRSYIHCYKGGAFWRDVVNSLGGFNRRAIEIILERESKEYSFEDLVYDWKEDKTNRQVVPHWSSFRDFIKSFRYMDEALVESVDNKKKTFKPIDKYLPENLDNMDLEDIDI